MSKIDKVLNGYNLIIESKNIEQSISKIKQSINENKTIDVLKNCFSCIDLTSLHHTDNEQNITKLVEKVNRFTTKYKDMPQIAAICVYPSMIETVKKILTENIEIAAVSGGFPSSQTFIEIKIAETGMCVMEGASEIDIVMSVGKYLNKEYESVAEEIQELKESCRNSTLKVILETGTLNSLSDIYKASIIAMEAGADFIKTSTGKTEPAATPEAAYTMCLAIKDFYSKTNKKVGFKAAGGIVSAADAITYYSIVKDILGTEWLNHSLFRIGASKLANNLLSTIYNKEEIYF